MAWTSLAIGDLVKPAATWNPLSTPEDVFKYIDLSAVDQDAKLIVGARELPCGEAPSRARQLVVAGDILVSTVRPNLNGVAQVPPSLDGSTASTGFCVLRPDPDRLHGEFLFQWVKTPGFVADMVKKATGASYPAVSDRIILQSRIPVAPLPEQRRIAEVLDRAEALRAKRRAALAQLDILTQSIFLDRFGDPVANPKEWPAGKPLGDVADIVSGITKGRKVNGQPVRSVPYLAVANVQDKALDLSVNRAKETSHGLGLFVRSLVGLDREAAKAALGGFLTGKSLAANQIEFVNLIVNHLTEHGVMEAGLLYESPFTDITPRGSEGLFSSAQLSQLMGVLDQVRRAAMAG